MDADGLARVIDAVPAFFTVTEGPELRVVATTAASRGFAEQHTVLGRPLAEAYPEAVAQGFVALMTEVMRTGQAREMSDWRTEMVRRSGSHRRQWSHDGGEPR